MSRPLCIEFSDAAYHVTSRGDRREIIDRDDDDRAEHLADIAHAMDRLDAQVLAYCLLCNHFHLVLHTRCHHDGLGAAIGAVGETRQLSDRGLGVEVVTSQEWETWSHLYVAPSLWPHLYAKLDTPGGWGNS